MSLLEDFNRLHWFWKLLLVSGTFGLAHHVVRAASGEPEPSDEWDAANRPLPPVPEPLPGEMRNGPLTFPAGAPIDPALPGALHATPACDMISVCPTWLAHARADAATMLAQGMSAGQAFDEVLRRGAPQCVGRRTAALDQLRAAVFDGRRRNWAPAGLLRPVAATATSAVQALLGRVRNGDTYASIRGRYAPGPPLPWPSTAPVRRALQAPREQLRR
jgi:hypothetical protein